MPWFFDGTSLVVQAIESPRGPADETALATAPAVDYERSVKGSLGCRQAATSAMLVR
jgi:hypothetical protein